MSNIREILFAAPKTPEEKKRNFKKVLIFFGVFVSLFIMFLLIDYFAGGSTKCTDMNCFIVKASQCKAATYEEVSDIGTISYSVKSESSGNCTLTKKILELSENEDAFLKKILEDKKMQCPYSQGEFNSQWTSSMVEGIEYCNGELRDAIGQLLILI